VKGVYQMRKLLYLVFILFVMITGCSVNSLRTPEINPETPAVTRFAEPAPVIKIGLMQNISSLSFTTDKTCSILNNANQYITRNAGVCNWSVKVVSSKPGSYIYLLVAASMTSRQRAEIKAADYVAMGFEVMIYQPGRDLKKDKFVKNKHQYFRVCIKRKFKTIQAARNYRDAIWNQLETFVTKYPVRQPGGTIVLTDNKSGKEFKSNSPLIIKGERIILHEVEVGKGFHWAHKEDRIYGGDVILQIDDEGELIVINQIGLEDYIMGVVPSEMPAGFPLEALKAQAIAARSEVLAKLGRAHVDDPFDVCADVHCQVYSGLSKREKSTDRAVRETHGLVLMADGKVIDAVYSAVCGGHTENAENAWGGQPTGHLTGVWDSRGGLRRYGKLTKEKNIRRYIDEAPGVYCNSTRGRIVASMEYTRKYFRWEVSLLQKDLQENLERVTGRNVGAIVNLLPLVRGTSGRIVSLKVEGRHGSYVIGRELKIRKALSKTTLWSACFYVRKGRTRGGGAPEKFILKGAGFGHGVGMCQTGAAGMALKRKKYTEILHHYYKGAKVRRIY